MRVPLVRLFLIAAAVPVLFLASSAGAAKKAPQCPPDTWGYHKPIGPERWPVLSPCNAQCANGGEQSPVDIEHPEPTRPLF